MLGAGAIDREELGLFLAHAYAVRGFLVHALHGRRCDLNRQIHAQRAS